MDSKIEMPLINLSSALFLIFFLFNILPVSVCAETLQVLGEKVSLRSSPDNKGKILFEYGGGFPLEVQKRQGDWVLVKDYENDTGWIHKSRIQKGNQVIVKANKDDDKTINLRSGAGTDSPIVGNAHYGVVFSVIEKKGGWLQVRHESGLTGWVKADLVWGL